MLDLELEYIDRINRQYESGKWIKTAMLTESPGVVTYWAEHEESITYQSHVYTPLAMYWEGWRTSVSMPTEGSNIALSNVGNQVVKYLKTLDPSGMAIM